MIRLVGTRFGDIEIEEASEIVFSQGLFGFPDARRFVLLYPGGRGHVAWLQSLEMAALAFPVVDGSAFGPNYPRPSAEQLAHDACLGATDLAVLVIIAAKKGAGVIANMLAPLIIDLESRKGAQIVLDPQRYSAAAQLRAGRSSGSRVADAAM